MSWNFEIKNLGKVQSAKIEMAPLVILVGRNDTGKSYVATTAWAVSNLFPLIIRPSAAELRPKWFASLMRKLTKDGSEPFQIDAEKAKDIINSVNSQIALLGDEFLRNTFAFDGIAGAQLAISANSNFVPFSVTATVGEGAADSIRSMPLIKLVEQDERATTAFRVPGSTREFNRRLADRVYVEILYRVLLGQPGGRRRIVTYIPAARTGLMLAYRSLVAQLFEAEAGAAAAWPRPLTDFLQRLAFGSTRGRHSKSGEIAAWISREILHGDIEVTDDDVPTVTYKPENTDIALPLHATSSMITELAPFLMLIRQDITGQLIFEEPEAHLHLSAQRFMARAIARLLNSGTNILITTHSDTFIQQINNLINLHSHPNRQKLMARLGYEASDLIDPMHTRAYEFVSQEGGTVVSQLKITEGGYAVPSLNETLIDLADETISLSGDLDD